MKAIGNSGEGLSSSQKADNYELFGKMMKEGVYLPDLVKKIDALESKINDLEKLKENPIDAQLFSVMESAVKDDPSVADAKRRLQSEKTRIISEMCIRDDAYRRAFEEYKRVVNAKYIEQKEG